MITINIKEQEHINGIMDNFDFERCERVMRALDWRWATIGYEIPTQSDIRKDARERLIRAVEFAKENKWVSNDNPYIISSGGIKATAFINKYKQLTFLKLEFIVAEWDEGGN